MKNAFKAAAAGLLTLAASILPMHAEAPIKEPAGSPSLYSRTELKRDILREEVWDSGIVDYIYFDNNDVYVRDLISDCADGTYIKGVITEGDKQNGVITFESGAYVADMYRVYVGTFSDDGTVQKQKIAIK